MGLSYKDSLRDTRLDAITSALGTTAYLEVFTGAPAGKTAGTFNTDPGTRLASLALSNPAATASSAGLLTFSAIASATGLASGTPASFRLKTAAGGGTSTVIVEGDAAIGSGSLNFASAISSGGTVSDFVRDDHRRKCLIDPYRLFASREAQACAVRAITALGRRHDNNPSPPSMAEGAASAAGAGRHDPSQIASELRGAQSRCIRSQQSRDPASPLSAAHALAFPHKGGRRPGERQLLQPTT